MTVPQSMVFCRSASGLGAHLRAIRTGHSLRPAYLVTSCSAPTTVRLLTEAQGFNCHLGGGVPTCVEPHSCVGTPYFSQGSWHLSRPKVNETFRQPVEARHQLGSGDPYSVRSLEWEFAKKATRARG